MFLYNKQPYKTWKNENNVKTYSYPYNIKNSYNTGNVNCTLSFNGPCGNFKFKAKPIIHYRKSLDCSNCSYEYIINNNLASEDPNNDLCYSSQNLVIKRANTKIDNEYCTSNSEYLYKKCRTFNQNLSKGISGEFSYISPQCDCSNNIVYRNKKYYTDSPITSSSRISNLKYHACHGKLRCEDSYLNKQTNNNNKTDCCDKKSLYQYRKPGGSKINVLK